MKRSDIDVLLAQAAVSLRGSNGPAWDKFMTALSARLDHITESFVSSSTPSDLPRLQGHALEARALFKALAEAPELVEQMRKQEQTHGTAPR